MNLEETKTQEILKHLCDINHLILNELRKINSKIQNNQRSDETHQQTQPTSTSSKCYN